MNRGGGFYECFLDMAGRCGLVDRLDDDAAKGIRRFSFAIHFFRRCRVCAVGMETSKSWGKGESNCFDQRGRIFDAHRDL